jgi:hypothetical protein
MCKNPDRDGKWHIITLDLAALSPALPTASGIPRVAIAVCFMIEENCDAFDKGYG